MLFRGKRGKRDVPRRATLSRFNLLCHKYIYDGDRIIAELDASNNTQVHYLYGTRIDEVLTMSKPFEWGWAIWYYDYDGLGSVSEIVDWQGVALEKYTYDEYGSFTITDGQGNPLEESPSGNRFYFTGREYDFLTRLYYYRARWYDSAIGRFLQTDPVGYKSDINLYRYCDSVGKLSMADVNLYTYARNNPINFTDPLGLWYVDINVSAGYWGGVTGGVMVNGEGVHPYAGGGAVTPPGGVAVTWSPSDPSPGWNAGLSGGFWGGGQVGYGFEGGGWFWELGFVTPGVSLTGYYVWEPGGKK